MWRCEMEYSIDLTKLLTQEYRELLLNQNLLPGRRILLENIKERFNIIYESGLHNVSELKKALSTPTKMSSFSKKTGISAVTVDSIYISEQLLESSHCNYWVKPFI